MAKLRDFLKTQIGSTFVYSDHNYILKEVADDYIVLEIQILPTGVSEESPIIPLTAISSLIRKKAKSKSSAVHFKLSTG